MDKLENGMDYVIKMLTITLSNKIKHKNKRKAIEDILDTVYKNGRHHRNISAGL